MPHAHYHTPAPLGRSYFSVLTLILVDYAAVSLASVPPSKCEPGQRRRLRATMRPLLASLSSPNPESLS